MSRLMTVYKHQEGSSCVGERVRPELFTSRVECRFLIRLITLMFSRVEWFA